MKKVITLIAFFLWMANIFGQDSTKVKNVLVIQSTKEQTWGPGPSSPPTVYKTGKRIRVVTNTINIVGKIEYISDSSITIKGKEIKLKDITRINKYRNGVLPAIGGAVTATGIGLFIYFARYYAKHTYDDDGTEGSASMGPELGSIFIAFAGAVATLVGVIRAATAKHYRMNGKWKFLVKPDIFTAPQFMNSPGNFNPSKDSLNRPPNRFMPMPFPKKKKAAK